MQWGWSGVRTGPHCECAAGWGTDANATRDATDTNACAQRIGTPRDDAQRSTLGTTRATLRNTATPEGCGLDINDSECPRLGLMKLSGTRDKPMIAFAINGLASMTPSPPPGGRKRGVPMARHSPPPAKDHTGPPDRQPPPAGPAWVIKHAAVTTTVSARTPSEDEAETL